MHARVPTTAQEHRQLREFLDRPIVESSGPDARRELGLWHRGQIIAASRWQREADDSAVLWHPKIPSHGTESATRVMAALVSAAADEARQAGCRFALSYIERRDWLLRRSLHLAGFALFTEFQCLNRPLEGDLSMVVGTAPGTAVPFKKELRQRFQDVFERTQGAGQDGATLGKLRSPAQSFTILSSAYSPAASGDWALWEVDGRDVALLLLNTHWNPTVLEITYLGVIPEMRRQGLGRGLIEWALNRAKSRHFCSVETNVDAGNPGARRLYGRLGFRRRSQHELFIKRW